MFKYILGVLLVVFIALFLLTPTHKLTSIMGVSSPSTDVVTKLAKENDSLRKVVATLHTSLDTSHFTPGWVSNYKIARKTGHNEKIRAAKPVSIPVHMSITRSSPAVVIIPIPDRPSDDQDSLLGRTHLLQDSLRKQSRKYAHIIVEMENSCSLQITKLQDSISKLHLKSITGIHSNVVLPFIEANKGLDTDYNFDQGNDSYREARIASFGLSSVRSIIKTLEHFTTISSSPPYQISINDSTLLSH